ncbi:hypothetical protein D9M68_513640 [compost metagenome]
MKKQTYQISIHAPASEVYRIMLGKTTYKLWTAEFNPTSDFEGSWNKGDKIYFTGINAEGKKEGMVARIAENIPDQFISISHLGILDGEKEITEGPMVEEWAGAHENYTFRENNGLTTVLVEVDTSEKYLSYFDETWPKALNRLKELCEK